MKFHANLQNLKKALETVRRAVPSRTHKEILKCVQVEAGGTDSVVLRGTDLDQFATVRVAGCAVVEGGFAAVPAKLLAEVLRGKDGDRATLSVAPDSHRLSVDGAELVGTDPELYPSTVARGGASFTVCASKLRELLDEVAFAAADYDTRYAISGVLLHSVAGYLTGVATDGRRLSKSVRPTVTAGTARTIVPKAFALSLLKSLPKKGAPLVSVLVGNVFATFSWLAACGEVELVTRTIDSRFPEFEDVIPKRGGASLVADAQDLLRSVRQVAAYCADDLRFVSFHVGPEGLTLSAESSLKGRGAVAVGTAGVKLEGKAFRVNLNPDYVAEALEHGADEVRLYFAEGEYTDRQGVVRQNAHEVPVLFELPFVHVVMPISDS